MKKHRLIITVDSPSALDKAEFQIAFKALIKARPVGTVAQVRDPDVATYHGGDRGDGPTPIESHIAETNEPATTPPGDTL